MNEVIDKKINKNKDKITSIFKEKMDKYFEQKRTEKSKERKKSLNWKKSQEFKSKKLSINLKDDTKPKELKKADDSMTSSISADNQKLIPSKLNNFIIKKKELNIIEEIGCGAVGKVYRAKFAYTDVAVKVFENGKNN